jgi:hypothetical protein
MASVRELVLAWDPFTDPTRHQYDMTMMWMKWSNGMPAVGASDRAKIRELIRRYEYNHPEIFPRGDCNGNIADNQ